MKGRSNGPVVINIRSLLLTPDHPLVVKMKQQVEYLAENPPPLPIVKIVTDLLESATTIALAMETRLEDGVYSDD